MSIIQLRDFLDLMMCSDPWPISGKGGEAAQKRLEEFADAASRDLGYDDWIDAYHKLLKATVHLATAP